MGRETEQGRDKDMKIAVIEDEKPHRDLLVRYLEEWRGDGQGRHRGGFWDGGELLVPV